jgi:MoaA/NifB/PqqE/SkfB family radical SAM enzyme
MSNQAEATFQSAVESCGGLVLGIEWEGRRLVGLVELPGGLHRRFWVVDDAGFRGFRSGRHFTVGDLDARGEPAGGRGGGSGASGPREIERLMLALLAAFDVRGPLPDWHVDPSRSEESSPALLFDGSTVELRITRSCNERCSFCNTAGGSQNVVRSLRRAAAALESARANGATSLSISGGEPLLVPWLPDLVERARAAGFDPVTVQTNAVLLSEPAVLDALTRLRPVLQVSLHASHPDLSDRLTGVTGLWDRKMLGIRLALQRGIPLNINHVACRENLDDLPAFIRMVRGIPRFDGYVGFSLVAPVGRAWRNRKRLVPTYTEAAGKLLAAMRLARDLGLKVMFPESCSVPLCIEPGLEPFCQQRSAGRVGLFPDRVKFERCPSCRFDARCPGVYRAYLDHATASEFDSNA